jgi:hypothetical protein
MTESIDEKTMEKMWIDIQLFGKKQGYITKDDILAIISPYISEWFRDIVANELLDALQASSLIEVGSRGRENPRFQPWG